MKKLDLDHGLKITESDDIGVVLHFRTSNGASGGIWLDPDFAGYTWALEMLADVPDIPDPEMDEFLKEVAKKVSGDGEDLTTH